MLLNFIQIALAGLLITVILLQQRGSGAGGAFGGGVGETYYAKRGTERFLYIASIVLGTAFLTLALLRHVL